MPGFSMPFTIVGQGSDPAQRPGAVVQQITPDYFRTFGVRLEKGRAFTEQDNATSMKVAMVNEDFVRHFLRGADPLRQRLVMQQFIPGVTKLGPAVEWQIVGVYHTVRSFGPRRDDAEIDIPFWQTPWDSASIGVRTAEVPASMTKSIAAAVHAVDRQMALTEVRTMDEVREEMFANDRFTMLLSSASRWLLFCWRPLESMALCHSPSLNVRRKWPSVWRWALPVLTWLG